MNKLFQRVGGLLVAALFLFSVTAQAFTLIVAPARYSVIQFAQDVLQRTPSVLVSYQGEATSEEPTLHAWNGSEWVPVSMKDYREVSFLQRVPDRTILIGGRDILPQSLVDASSWSPRVERITDLNTSGLVNEFGRILNWRTSEWQWFAKRYNLSLEDEAAARRSSSWYDQAGPLPDRPRPLGTLLESGSEPEPAPVTDVNMDD
ncbi:MAG: hypothetical protein M5U15_11800 [Kiritimatiellae bacterium]|nr:hypothetical protein [Kiritimatiellia bacterium]